MTEPTPLSPAAQAVWAAWEKTPIYSLDKEQADRDALAAALRAAADLVCPNNYSCFTGHIDWDSGMEARNDTIRENLLSIAAELEAQ